MIYALILGLSLNISPCHEVAAVSVPRKVKGITIPRAVAFEAFYAEEDTIMAGRDEKGYYRLSKLKDGGFCRTRA